MFFMNESSAVSSSRMEAGYYSGVQVTDALTLVVVEVDARRIGDVRTSSS